MIENIIYMYMYYLNSWSNIYADVVNLSIYPAHRNQFLLAKGDYPLFPFENRKTEDWHT